ncbi:hypothetical protein CDL15_Pgr007430 [Punica granatum]|uniref:Gnk2-homologous domain-containing protein n=1 Tax=Punica granatum TaxID=22663 RepID=A0A218XAM2_PUNGR|nr:hypothetical protein CDL15_Pgr007430 [Punica granatum]
MDAIVRAAAIAIGLLCIYSSAICSAGTPDGTVLSKICNGVEFSSKQYDENRRYVISQLLHNTPKVGFNYYERSPSSDHIIYGHAACKGKLSKGDCEWCLGDAVKELFRDRHECPLYTTGAQIHLQDCRLRFEVYEFDD